jgi:hypothetical protein
VAKLLAAPKQFQRPALHSRDNASGITPGLPLLSSGRAARVIRDDFKVINYPTDILVYVPKVIQDANQQTSDHQRQSHVHLIPRLTAASTEYPRRVRGTLVGHYPAETGNRWDDDTTAKSLIDLF